MTQLLIAYLSKDISSGTRLPGDGVVPAVIPPMMPILQGSYVKRVWVQCQES